MIQWKILQLIKFLSTLIPDCIPDNRISGRRRLQFKYTFEEYFHYWGISNCNVIIFYQNSGLMDPYGNINRYIAISIFIYTSIKKN